jgi:hypothetical protein
MSISLFSEIGLGRIANSFSELDFEDYNRAIYGDFRGELCSENLAIRIIF